MELFLSPVLFYTCSVYANNVANTSYLRAVLNPLSMENAVDKFVAFAGLVSECIVRLVNHLNRANILVVCGFVGQGRIYNHTVDVNLILVRLEFAKWRIDHLIR